LLIAVTEACALAAVRKYKAIHKVLASPGDDVRLLSGYVLLVDRAGDSTDLPFQVGGSSPEGIDSRIDVLSELSGGIHVRGYIIAQSSICGAYQESAELRLDETAGRGTDIIARDAKRLSLL
jgi:hypothetical protein